MSGIIPKTSSWSNSLLFYQEAIVSEHSEDDHKPSNDVRIFVSVMSSHGVYGFKSKDDVIKFESYGNSKEAHERPEYLVLHNHEEQIYDISILNPQKESNWPWQVIIKSGEQYKYITLHFSFAKQRHVELFVYALDILEAIQRHVTLSKAIPYSSPSIRWLNALCNKDISTIYITNQKLTVNNLQVLSKTAKGGVSPRHQIIQKFHFAFVPMALDHMSLLIEWIRNNEKYLVALTLQECQLDDVCFKALFGGLLSTRVHLKEMNLSGNLIITSLNLITRYIIMNPMIKKLDLSSNKISPGNMSCLLNLLLQSEIEYLDLSKNMLGDRGAVFLSKILPRCKNLRTLKLNYCNIGLDGMRALLLSLCDSTRDLCAVESLFIEHNHLDESIIPVVGMTLSKSENSVKTIRIGGHFDFQELLRKLEPAEFQERSVGFGTFTLANYGTRDVIRKIHPKIRIFIRTATSVFDVEYFICMLCTALNLPAAHCIFDAMEKHGRELVVLHLKIQDMLDVIGRTSRVLPRNYELKAKLLHLYGNKYAPIDGPLYDEDPVFEETVLHELEELGIVNIDSVSTTDAEDIEAIKKEDEENDDYSAPLGDMLYSPPRKLATSEKSIKEKIEMLDKMFDFAAEMKSSDNMNDIDWTDFDYEEAVKVRNEKRNKNKSRDNDKNGISMQTTLMEGDKEERNENFKDEDVITENEVLSTIDSKTKFTKDSSSSPQSNASLMQHGIEEEEKKVEDDEKQKEKDERIGTKLGAEEITTIMSFVVHELCDENFEIDEGKLTQYRQDEVMGNHVKRLDEIRFAKGGIKHRTTQEIRLISNTESPPDMLPATKMRIKILESIQKRDAEKCLSILDEDERFGTPVLQENDIMSARRFLRQDQAIRARITAIMDGDDSTSPQVFINEIARAAKFGCQNSFVHAAVMEYGKRLNLTPVNRDFMNIRFIVQAMQQRKIDAINSAMSNIDEDSDQEQFMPLLLACEELMKKLRTAQDLLRDSIAIADLNRGVLVNLESSLFYAAQVKISNHNMLWDKAIEAHSKFAKDHAVEYCLKACVTTCNLTKLIHFLENGDERMLSLPMYKHGVKIVQHTSYLVKIIETIENLKGFDDVIKHDINSLERSQEVLARIRELLEFANRIPVLTNGSFLPFENVVSWYNGEEIDDAKTKDKGTSEDMKTVEKNEQNFLDEDGNIYDKKGRMFEDQSSLLAGQPSEDNNDDDDVKDEEHLLNELEDAVNLLDLKKHWEITSAIIQSEEQSLSSAEKRKRYVKLQLKMAACSDGALSSLFDESLLNAKAWNIDNDFVHIAKILSAVEEVRTGRADGYFVYCNFTLDGPASRMEEKYLMGLGADSPLRLECWENLRATMEFRSGSNKQIGLHMVDYSQQMLSFTRAGIPTSLTMLSEWESNEAVLIFNKIRNGIQRTKRSPSYFSTMRLLASRISLASKKFSEEMFIQLAKLLRKNPSSKELETGWEMMSVWLRTRHIDKNFLPTLKHFVFTQATYLFQQPGRDLQIVYRIARFCATILSNYDYFFEPCEASERFFEFSLQSPKVVQVLFPDNSWHEYKVLSFTSAAQLLEDICANEEQDVLRWRNLSLHFLNDKYNKTGRNSSRITKDAIKGPYASMLKPEEDVLWACGQYMVARKVLLPVRSTGYVQCLALVPYSILRNEPIFSAVEKLNQTSFARLGTDRLIYFHILNTLKEGKHTISMESYAFIASILHCLFNENNSKLMDKAEMYRTLKMCVPLKTLRIEGAKSMMSVRMQDFVKTFSKSETYNSEYFQTAFIQYVKSFPFYGGTRFDNLTVAIESHRRIKKFRSSIIVNANGVFILKRKTGRMVTFVTYKQMTAVALSQKDRFFQFMTNNSSIRVSAVWSICKDFCRAFSNYLSSLLRSHHGVVDLKPREIVHRWEKDKVFGTEITIPDPPQIELDEEEY